MAAAGAFCWDGHCEEDVHNGDAESSSPTSARDVAAAGVSCGDGCGEADACRRLGGRRPIERPIERNLSRQIGCAADAGAAARSPNKGRSAAAGAAADGGTDTEDDDIDPLPGLQAAAAPAGRSGRLAAGRPSSLGAVNEHSGKSIEPVY